MEMNFLTLYLLPLIVGWVLDLMFGDPEKLPHPVVLFGKLIAKGERLLNRGSWRRMKGALLAIGRLPPLGLCCSLPMLYIL